MTRDNRGRKATSRFRAEAPTRRSVLKTIGAGAAILPATSGVAGGSTPSNFPFEDDFNYTDTPLNHGWEMDTSKDSPCRSIKTDGEFLEIDAGNANHCSLYQEFSLAEPIAPRVEMRGRCLENYRDGEGKVRIVITADGKSINDTNEMVSVIFTQDDHPEILFYITENDRYFERNSQVNSFDWQELAVWFDGEKIYGGTPSEQFFTINDSPSPTQNFRVYVSNGSTVTEHDWIRAFRVEDEIEVEIDVKPDSEKNPINSKSKGVIPVAILNTDDFDPVAQVDISTLRFGDPDDVKNGGGSTPSHGGHVEDVDDDGDDDLLLHFPTEDAGFDGDEDSARLAGETEDGTPLFGSDTVKIVGGSGKGGGPG